MNEWYIYIYIYIYSVFIGICQRLGYVKESLKVSDLLFHANPHTNSRVAINVPPHWQQGQQCAYNVTLQLAGLTVTAVEKQLSVTYSERVCVCVCVCVCVFVALVIQHAKPIHRIMIIRLYHISAHYFIKGACNVCFDILHTFCLKRFSYKKNSGRYYHKCT